jgi:inhibitor of cysteine peptidase
MIELLPENSGSRQAVRVGEPVVIRLPETPTTGFRWRPSFDESQVRLVDDQYHGAANPRGASGQRVFTFEGLVAGSTPLKIEKVRSWEGEPDDEFSVDLDATQE